MNISCLKKLFNDFYAVCYSIKNNKIDPKNNFLYFR